VGDLNFRNVQHRCAGVDMSLDRPTVDLADVTWFEPYALMYLGMFLRHHNRNGKFFEVVPPTQAQARGYLDKQNFGDRFGFNPGPDLDPPALRFLGGTSFNDIVDLENRADMAEEVGERLLELLRRNPVRVHTQQVAEAVSELVDNFAQHAQEGLAAMMVQYYPNKGEVRIAVGDCGIGIKQSLLGSGRYPEMANLTHKRAIVEAFKLRVTRKHEGGMGFEFVREIVENNDGELFLSSFDGCVYVKHGRMYYIDAPYDLPGVQVELRFPERR